MSFFMTATAVLALSTYVSAAAETEFCGNPTGGFAWPENINDKTVIPCSKFTVKWNVAPDAIHKDHDVSFKLLCGPSPDNLAIVQDIGSAKNSAKSFEWTVRTPLPEQCTAKGAKGLQMRSIQNDTICQTSSRFDFEGGACGSTSPSTSAAESSSAVKPSAVESSSSAAASPPVADSKGQRPNLQANAKNSPQYTGKATDGNNEFKNKTQALAEGPVNGTANPITEVPVEKAVALVLEGATAANISGPDAQRISNECSSAVGGATIKTKEDAAKVVGAVAAAAAKDAKDENVVFIVVSCIQSLVIALMGNGPVSQGAIGVIVAAAASGEQREAVTDCVGAFFNAVKQDPSKAGFEFLLSAQLGQAAVSGCKSDKCRTYMPTTLKATGQAGLRFSMSVFAAARVFDAQSSGQASGGFQLFADRCIERATGLEAKANFAIIVIETVQSFSLPEADAERINQATEQVGRATQPISYQPPPSQLDQGLPRGGGSNSRGGQTSSTMNDNDNFC